MKRRSLGTGYKILLILEILLMLWVGTYAFSDIIETTTFEQSKYKIEHEKSVVNVRSVFGQCSGVIGKRNYVVTAAHCVDKDGLYLIMFHDGEVSPGYAIYIDEKEDFAIVRAQTDGYPSAHFSARELEFGEFIYHIRYNFGDDGQWAANGIYAKYLCDTPLLPTDACLHWLAFAGVPGDSGGAVYDDQGYVIGIMSLSYWPIGAPMSMAVPAEHIMDVLQDL